MITIKDDMETKEGVEYTARELMDILNDMEVLGTTTTRPEGFTTTFIGRSPQEDKLSLYLICYGCVVRLEDPINTWNGDQRFSVKEFVDIDINIRSIK